MLSPLADGIYSLTYSAVAADTNGSVHGLAIVKDGMIIGSDAAGALFQGAFEVDPDGGPPIVRGQLRVPPDGALMTGFAAGRDGATLDVFAKPDETGSFQRFMAHVAGADIVIEVVLVGALPRCLSVKATRPS